MNVKFSDKLKNGLIIPQQAQLEQLIEEQNKAVKELEKRYNSRPKLIKAIDSARAELDIPKFMAMYLLMVIVSSVAIIPTLIFAALTIIMLTTAAVIGLIWGFPKDEKSAKDDLNKCYDNKLTNLQIYKYEKVKNKSHPSADRNADDNVMYKPVTLNGLFSKNQLHQPVGPFPKKNISNRI